MAENKNQHYIPQTYLKKWEDGNRLLWLYNKDDDSLKYPQGIKKENVFYQKNLYTKTPDDYPTFTETEKIQFFEPLRNHTLTYDGKQLDPKEGYENLYQNFPDWDIRRLDNSKASNKKLKQQLESYTNKDIEKNWACIENNWDILCDKIVNQVILGESISDEDRRKLIQFIVTLEFRNPKQISNYRVLIEDFFKPVFNHPTFNHPDILEEFLKCADLFFKSQIQKFQDNSEEENLISLTTDALFAYGHIYFYTTKEEKFITCDNPIIIEKKENLKDHPSIKVLFPLTPNILVHIQTNTDKNPKLYTVIPLDQSTVTNINQGFKENAEEYYIKCN